jgi:hypothetical protein
MKMAESRIAWPVRHLSTMMAALGTPLTPQAVSPIALAWPRRTKGFRSVPMDGTHYNKSRRYPYASDRQIERQDRQHRRAEYLKNTTVMTDIGISIPYAALNPANKRRVRRIFK